MTSTNLNLGAWLQNIDALVAALLDTPSDERRLMAQAYFEHWASEPAPWAGDVWKAMGSLCERVAATSDGLLDAIAAGHDPHHALTVRAVNTYDLRRAVRQLSASQRRNLARGLRRLSDPHGVHGALADVVAP